MTASLLTIPEIRAKLDNLIAHVERRVDETERQAREEPTTAARRLAASVHEHTLGRLHGLAEARELLDALEMQP